MSYIKSPMNYIGGKYRLLPELLPLFPPTVNKFVDLFAGGLDVCINIKFEKIYANDVIPFIIDIYHAFQHTNLNSLLEHIENTIKTWSLSKTNLQGYLDFRNFYNSKPVEERDPLDLFVLICYSFNHQLRFNSKMEFNCSFGKNKSSFNPVLRNNLIAFYDRIQPIEFTCADFRDIDLSHLSNGDFLYADPPYRITTGSYNDGKRQFGGWTVQDDLALFELLDRLSAQGVKFALSNVTHSKGTSNEELIRWMSRHTVHRIEKDYGNCNYHRKDRHLETREVLVTNY